MIDLFVSHDPGSSDHGPALVAALRSAGCTVIHSPGPEAMDDGYASGLAAVLDACSSFVCVASPTWASSRWMAIEADEALRRFDGGRIGGYFCYDPDAGIVNAAGMLACLLTPLPRGLSDAVAVLLASLPSRGCIADLFAPEPSRWGLRGDPFLWREMRERLRPMPLPRDRAGLARLLSQTFEALTGQALSDATPMFLGRHDHGGMSSGRISPEFWRDTAIPLLISRCPC